MLTQYMQAALAAASHEMIEDEEPFYGEVAGLDGVGATGKTPEECRNNLSDSIEDWLLFSIAKGLPIPPLQGISIKVPEEIIR